ncbi:I66 family serine proteinase inhibitor [Kitasatospora sp. NPDC059577]|uniref:I66 family serine proteinase inhibitor n=1 Tax=Kitasatospora sp. NPDC059577 TaxID=3346873 RepID=UPI0036ABC9D1
MTRLDSGLHLIHAGTALVGRALHETEDLSPKVLRVDTDDRDAIWIVEALPDGRYNLYSKGAPAGIEDNGTAGPVVTFLVDQADAVTWELAPVADTGNAYRITGPQGTSWAVTGAGKQSRIEAVPTPGDVFTFTRIGP